MTDFTRHNLPADITVLHGTFASQPLVFAHLLDEAPDLDMGHVEVIQSNHHPRLAAYFDEAQARDLAAQGETLVLILPLAFAGDVCPVGATEHLTLLGTYRGTVPHMGSLP